MTARQFLSLLGISAWLCACSEPADEAADIQANEVLFKTQREALDRAHDLEQDMRDMAEAQRRRLEEQSR